MLLLLALVDGNAFVLLLQQDFECRSVFPFSFATLKTLSKISEYFSTTSHTCSCYACVIEMLAADKAAVAENAASEEMTCTQGLAS